MLIDVKYANYLFFFVQERVRSKDVQNKIIWRKKKKKTKSWESAIGRALRIGMLEVFSLAKRRKVQTFGTRHGAEKI